MWVSVSLIIAATLTGQDGQAPSVEPAPRYGSLRAAANAELARRAVESGDEAASWGIDLGEAPARLNLSQRLQRECAQTARAADEDEAACRERIIEGVIQDSLARGGAMDRAGDWSEVEEGRWVQAPARNPADRLGNCRQSSQRSQDGETSSWSIRCGDRDGPAAEALDRLLELD